MPKMTTIYWRDIPAQVIGQQGRKRYKQEMPQRFSRAIDRAAMRAGRGSSNAFLEDWRRESCRCESEVEQAVKQQVNQLETQFPDDILELVVKAGGVVKLSGTTD